MRRFMILALIVACVSISSCKKNSSQTSEVKNNFEAIFTPSAPKPIGNYSQAIKCHQTIYISGQIGLDPESMLLVQGNLESQIRQVFDNVAAVVKASGATMGDITKLTIYLTDLNASNKVYEIMNDYFHQPFPARSLVAVAALPKRAKIEVDAVVENPSSLR